MKLPQLTYKKWVSNSIYFILSILIFVTTFSVTIHMFFYTDSNLYRKLYLLENNPSIFFAGDSRAYRQLNPIIAAKYLNKNASNVANIAVDSGDVVSTYNTIKQYPEKFLESTIVISVSANQINDGAKQPGYYSDSMISKLNIYEQIDEFGLANHETLTWYYQNIIKSFFQSFFKKKKKKNENTLGFLPIYGKLNITNRINETTNHPWYEKWNINGRKIVFFEEALLLIKSNVKNLYVYSGPLAPSHIEFNKDNFLIKNELDFNAKIQLVCQKHNIRFVNYFNDKRFEDKDFYDPMHLNSDGAQKFTEIVMDELCIQLFPFCPNVK